jgi:hypothetical protein
MSPLVGWDASNEQFVLSTKMNTKQNGKNTMINTKQMIQKQG